MFKRKDIWMRFDPDDGLIYRWIPGFFPHTLEMATLSIDGLIASRWHDVSDDRAAIEQIVAAANDLGRSI